MLCAVSSLSSLCAPCVSPIHPSPLLCPSVARAAHGMGPAGVVSASNHAVSSPVSVLTVCSLCSPHPPPALHTPQLLEQCTSWGQQVSSVPTTTLTAHWILFEGLLSPFPLLIPPILEPPPSQLLEQRTSWGQQVSSVLLAMLAAAVLASLSVLPTTSPVYDFVWTRVMPMAVALVLLETDVTSAFTQSGPGLLAFMLGAAGTIAGTLVGFSLAGPSLGVEGWKVAACFCATYIGGSVNYAATAKPTCLTWRWRTSSSPPPHRHLLSLSLPDSPLSSLLYAHPRALGMDITAGAAAASTGASLLTAGMVVDNLLMAAYFSMLSLPPSLPSLPPPPSPALSPSLHPSLPSHTIPQALGMDITAGAAAASMGASLLTAGMAVDNLLMAAYFSALGMDITAGAAAASTGASLLTAGMAVDNLLMAAYFSVLAALPDSWPKPWGGERWGGVKLGGLKLGGDSESEKGPDTGLSAPLLHSSTSPTSSPSSYASSSSSSLLHSSAPLPSPSPPSSSSSLTHSPPPAPSVESLTLSIAAAASACALADKIAVHLPPVMASAQLALAAVLASLLSTVANRLTGSGEKRETGEGGLEGEERGSLFTGAETLGNALMLVFFANVSPAAHP
ncbi:unnamed protein product [Closterium sp. NIES-53]